MRERQTTAQAGRRRITAMTTSVSDRPHAGLLAWLDQHAIDREFHEHEETFTATSTARSEGIDARTFAKVVGVATDDGRHALLVVDAPDRIDLRKAREVLGSAHVRLLTEPELIAVTPGCEPGAVPAIGALFGLPMYVDHAVKEDHEISFNAGTHRWSVRVDRAAWERAAAVQYVDLAADPDDRSPWAAS
jgi:Ala-tRNA(Pro) deacylase